ncbi:hypothetical protein NW762_009352 [Fusarium torreyae]|uniref:Ethyl tert-butyl ether degradation EthD n=1 Tax=Fusarium torreyae TaxID=1237075 RepID=A0A9W8RUE3_9HYPO|nr:hypothetical protein NW762_009352 [Fusarium torreyae]
MSHQAFVLYPSGPSFDMDYYLKKHMPFVSAKFGPLGLKSWKIISFEEGAPFQVQATLEWDSIEAIDKAVASEAGKEVFGDVPNFYSEQPVLLKGPVVGAETISSS